MIKDCSKEVLSPYLPTLARHIDVKYENGYIEDESQKTMHSALKTILKFPESSQAAIVKVGEQEGGY